MPQSSMQIQAEFSEVVVWSHETAIDASAHPHMRAIQEWLALAKKVRHAMGMSSSHTLYLYSVLTQLDPHIPCS
jgi:hypothetical protein